MRVRVAVAVSLLVVVFAVASFIPGRAQESTNNNAQATKNWAALLKWYQANQTTSFTMGKKLFLRTSPFENIPATSATRSRDRS